MSSSRGGYQPQACNLCWKELQAPFLVTSCNHVFCLSLHSRRAELAASGGKDSVVYLWDVAQGQALRRTELPVNPTDVVFGRGASDHLLLTALDSTNAGMRGVVAAWPS